MSGGGERVLQKGTLRQLVRSLASQTPIPFAPQDAAERLRALGWVCVEPGKVEAAVAGAEARQVAERIIECVEVFQQGCGVAGPRFGYLTGEHDPLACEECTAAFVRAVLNAARPMGGTP